MVTRSVTALALLGVLTCASSLGDEPAGISGIVVDAAGHRLPDVPIQLYRLPLVERDGSRMHLARTNSQGFFVQLGLDAGTYVIVADAQGTTMRCVIRNIYGGRVRRVTLAPAKNGEADTCDRPWPANFDPDETSDVYRIR